MINFFGIKKLKEQIKLLKRNNVQQKKEIKKLKFFADYDQMTGVYNRHGFMREAEKFVHQLKNELKKPAAQRRRMMLGNFSVIFVDLDGLKAVNDRYGHEAGDKYIKVCAKTLKKNLRDLDVIARWGGDEFVIGLIGAETNEDLKIAEKLRKKIAAIKIAGVPKKLISASFGVIAAVDHHRTIDNLKELIDKADKAMYKAKKEMGKNFVVVYGELATNNLKYGKS